MKPALLLVDNQVGIFDEGPVDAPAFLARLKALLAGARASGVPVLHVQHAGPPGDSLAPGQPGWELHPELAPAVGEPVIGKRFNSAFKDTDLADQLAALGVTDLVIAGMQTEFCIDATIKSAFDRGFRLTVPQGGHTTCDNGTLTAAQLNDHYSRQIWAGRFAQVVPVDEVLATFGAARTR